MTTEDKVRASINVMTIGEMQEELFTWRSSAVGIAIAMSELEKFKQFAPSAEILASQINQLVATYKGTIEIQNRDIAEMSQILQDPLGIEVKFSKDAKANTKH